MSDQAPVVTRTGADTFRVEHDGRTDLVYVAGPVGRRWMFWNGQVFREDRNAGTREAGTLPGRASGPEAVRAPMPARVLTLLVQPGASVRRGDTLVVLEAMKMEMPLYAPRDATVSAVHCRQGELVDADAALIVLE